MQCAIAEDGSTYIVIHWWRDKRLACATDAAGNQAQRSDDPRAVTCALCREKIMQLALDHDGSTYAVIHFESRKHLACSPQEENLNASPERGHTLQRSDDPRAVTCPLCKNTLAWAAAMQAAQAAMKSKKVKS